MSYMTDEGFNKKEQLPVLMTRTEWEETAESITRDSELAGLRIIKSIDNKTTGHRAFCFSDGRGTAYVVFRGTSGDAEWLDNGLGMLVAETPAQKAALKFAAECRELPRVKYLIVAGHSKGGNKAQYCAVAGINIADKCISVDGQGFSRLFFNKYGDIIEKGIPKIIAVSERRDFVNCLGFYLQKPEYYTGFRGGISGEFPHGQPLPYFHCPDALRSDTGEAGKTAPVSHISEAVNHFVTYYLTEAKYDSKREDTVMGLVSLMTAGRGGKAGINAAVEAALAFFELCSRDKGFRKELHEVLLYEKNVIAATTHMIKENRGRSGELSERVMKRFAQRLMRNPRHFRLFVRNAERFVRFVQTTREIREYAASINYFIKGVFRHFEQLKVKGKQDVR